MSDGAVRPKSYGTVRVSGRAHANVGDTYTSIVNNNFYYLGYGPPALPEYGSKDLANLPQHIRRAPKLLNSADVGLNLSPNTGAACSSGILPTGDPSTSAIDTRLASPAAVTDGLGVFVFAIAGICTKILGRMNSLKDDAYLDAVMCRVNHVSFKMSILGSSLRLMCSEEDGNGGLQECLTQTVTLLVKIDEALVTSTPAANINLFRSVVQSRRSRIDNQHLRDLAVQLDGWQFKIDAWVLSRLSEENRERESAVMTVPLQGLASITAYRPPKGKGSRSSSCGQGLCRCLCHQPLRQTRRPILAASAHPLHRCSCMTREVWISVAMMRKFFSVRLEVQWTHGLTVDWSLKYRHTVRRMNPGRIILGRLRCGMIDFDDARQRLIDLRNANRIDFADIDADGDGLLEVRLCSMFTTMSSTWS